MTFSDLLVEKLNDPTYLDVASYVVDIGAYAYPSHPIVQGIAWMKICGVDIIKLWKEVK